MKPIVLKTLRRIDAARIVSAIPEIRAHLKNGRGGGATHRLP